MLIPMCGFKALLPLSQSLPSNTPEEGYCLLLNSLNTSPLLTARNTVHLLMCQSIEGGQLPFWVRKRELYLWRGKSVCQAPLVAQTVKNPPAVRETWVQFLGWKIPWRRIPLQGTLQYGNPLQYSCLENPHGQRSLAGYGPWGCKESDKTKNRRSICQYL